jgi:hypothetical protein
LAVGREGVKALKRKGVKVLGREGVRAGRRKGGKKIERRCFISFLVFLLILNNKLYLYTVLQRDVFDLPDLAYFEWCKKDDTKNLKLYGSSLINQFH